ncbi:MAG: acyltransferase [Bacteroidales bacterium]
MSIDKVRESNRVFGLDIIRAAAIILVVIGHGSFLLKNTWLEGFPYFRMIDGVDLFFVLSGFLIGGILLKEINSEAHFGFKGLARFWKRRWLRTLPNYYLILLANYLIIYFGIIHEDIEQFNWKFLLFLQNFSKPFYDFFWESWSLTVEEWFYITSPLLLLVFLKFLSPKKSFLLVTLLMILLPVIYRIWNFNPSIDNFWYDVTIRKIVLARLDSIAFGLLAAWLYYYFPAFWKKSEFVSLAVGIALILFIVNYSLPNTTFYKQVISFSITPLSAMLLLPVAAGIRTGKGFVARAVTHVSVISYSMYLLHNALIAEVIRDNFPPTSEIDGIIKYICYWVIVIAGSTLLYKFYERPIMQLRGK